MHRGKFQVLNPSHTGTGRMERSHSLLGLDAKTLRRLAFMTRSLHRPSPGPFGLSHCAWNAHPPNFLRGTPRRFGMLLPSAVTSWYLMIVAVHRNR